MRRAYGMTTAYCTSSRKPSETPTGGTCSRTSAFHSTLAGEQLPLLARSVCVVTAVIASTTLGGLSTAVGFDRYRSLLLELFFSVLSVTSSVIVYQLSFSLHQNPSMYLLFFFRTAIFINVFLRHKERERNPTGRTRFPQTPSAPILPCLCPSLSLP